MLSFPGGVGWGAGVFSAMLGEISSTPFNCFVSTGSYRVGLWQLLSYLSKQRFSLSSPGNREKTVHNLGYDLFPCKEAAITCTSDKHSCWNWGHSADIFSKLLPLYLGNLSYLTGAAPSSCPLLISYNPCHHRQNH